MQLKADFHMHTKEDRFDRVRYSARELIDVAAKKDYELLAITNHDTFTYDKSLSEYAADRGILLISGVEKTIERKHVLILNGDAAVERIETFSDLKAAKQDGIFTIAPHPFFRLGVCLGDHLLKHIELFDGIEHNAFYSKKVNFNVKAVEVANQFNLPVIGNSDTHILKQFGLCYSLIEAEKNVESVLDALRNHKVQVVSGPVPILRLVSLGAQMRFRT